jgi:hypothetical protein
MQGASLAQLDRMRAAGIATKRQRIAARQAAGVKFCSRCSTVKELDDFRVSSSTPDGRGYWCRACRGQADRQRYDRRQAERRAEAERERLAVALARVKEIRAKVDAQRARQEALSRWLVGVGEHPDREIRERLEEVAEERRRLRVDVDWRPDGRLSKRVRAV